MKYLLYSLTILLLNASNCSTPNKFSSIKFGEGGGFTGAVTTYELKSDGVLLKKDIVIKKISKSEIKKIQSKLDAIPTQTFKFNHPFNIYYFIEIDKGKIIWGDPAHPAPIEVIELYEILKSHTNN